MAEPGAERQRLTGVDAMKAVAVFFVICIHTNPFEGVNSAAFHIIDQLSRFAVPFFFILGGYFLRAGLERRGDGSYWGDYLLRLLFAYLFWTAFYLAMPRFGLIAGHGPVGGMLLSVKANLTEMGVPGALLKGSYFHLWFLPALMTAVGLVYVFDRFLNMKALLTTGALLYMAALLGSAYSGSPLGFDPGFRMRIGPFFSLLFVSTGFWFYGQPSRAGRYNALVLLALGVSMHFTEWALIKRLYAPERVEFLLMTAPMAMGAFLFSLGWRQRGRLRGLLAGAGRYSLGIYCIHPFFIAMLMRLAPGLPNYMLPPLVFMLSLATVSLIGRIGPIGRARIV